MQDEETDGGAERVGAGKEVLAALELVEHASPDLGVAEEMDLAARSEGARLDLADVVEERGPPHFEARVRLRDDLLRVFPHVLVPELAVAEADHALDFWKYRV